ncbi:MAG: tripartite tricarboxylate transporter substrate binding protein [Achromobacter sp.]|jgi:tripartite-type tricarboxylate transporter receptor subunit TctC
MSYSTSRLLRWLVAPLAAMLMGGAAAAAYPERPITIIVPFNAGTTPDILTRMLGDAMSRDLGQSVVVMNRVGASGIIGTQAVINAQPDGYTIGFANAATLAINQSLYKKLPYDADTQLQPVAETGSVQNVLAVRTALGVNSVAELIAYAKANPGKLTVGSGGNGTTGHLSAEMFKAMAGVSIMHVPYKGGLEADLALLRGEVDLVFENVASILPYLSNPSVKPLAVTGTVRDFTLPELPTMAESGLKGYQAVAWTGFVAPAAVDKKIADRLNQSVNKALETPEIQARLKSLAISVEPGPTDALFKRAVRERPIWAEAVRSSGAVVD